MKAAPVRSIRILVLSALALLSQVAGFAAPAYRAEDFVESLGLAASPFDRHLDSGPWKGAGTKYPPETFFDLGIRYYRTSLRNDLVREDQPKRVAEWWARTGARPLLLVDPGKSRTLKTDWMKVSADGDFAFLLEDLKRYPAGSVAGVEGPNELNNKFPPQDLNLKYRGRTDEAAGALYQRYLFDALRADPATRGIPLVAFTAIFTDYRLAHPCDAFDFANMHSYQGAGVPSSSLAMNMTRFNNILPVGATIRPFQPTECGYNVEEDKTNQQGYTGSRRAQAYNIPMLYAEYFRHGIPRTYLFALHNADGYGLLESDQETKRPSWFAVQSFVRLLADAKWDTETKAWIGGRAFEPRALRLALEGAPPTVHSLVLQKESGDWFLLLWNEVANFRDGRDAENAPVPVTIRFAPGTPVECNGLFSQGEIGGEAASGAFARIEPTPQVADARLVLGVPARVVVLQLRPTAPAVSGLGPMPPTRISGTATENTIDVRIELPKSPHAEEVVLYRNDRPIATLPAAETIGFTDDSAWIRPALGYRYAARTVAADGRMSKPVGAIIVTPDRRPDLIVGNFAPKTEDGAAIRAGDEIAFEGEIRNIGDGATPRPAEPNVGMWDSSVAITFRIDGEVASWGADVRPFAPGDERTLVATGGPGNRHRWTASEGGHVLVAEVDDINRISSERDKSNNVASRSIVVGEYPGLLALESRPAPGAVDLSADGTLDWVDFGRWRDEGKTARRKGEPLIGKVAQFGEGHIGVTGGSPVAMRWHGGEGLDTADGNHDGLWANRVGNGYTFTVAAGTEERLLRVYVSGINGARGAFSATLSDGSAPGLACNAWNGNRAHDWAPVPGGFSALYTIRYRAATDGQTLRVTWKMQSEPNQFQGQIRLQAATLRGGASSAE